MGERKQGNRSEKGVKGGKKRVRYEDKIFLC
jgi:hypothetical protein